MLHYRCLFPLAGFTINRSTINLLVPHCSETTIKLACYSYVTANLDDVVAFLDHLVSCIDVLTVSHSLNELALDEPEEASVADESLKAYMHRIEEILKTYEKRSGMYEKSIDAKIEDYKKQMDEHLRRMEAKMDEIMM